MLEFLHKYAKLCSFCTQIGIETVPRVVNIAYRASLPLPMWSSALWRLASAFTVTSPESGCLTLGHTRYTVDEQAVPYYCGRRLPDW